MRAALIMMALVAGCEQKSTPEGEDQCNASVYQELLGEPANAAEPLPEPKRIYGLGDPVTMDFNPARLNVKLDAAGLIVEIDCG